MLKTAILILFLWTTTVWAKPVTTVDHVDLPRYMGTWYEVASIPQFFQRKCFSDTKAEYSLLSNNRVRVYNSCLTRDRKLIGSEGRAKVVDNMTNAKLKVTFANLGERFLYVFGGKYWIIDLDPNYRYAVVGHPKLTYGWILSRDPQMKDADMHDLRDILTAKGYDTCKFMITPQRHGFTTKGRLCDLVGSETLQQARAD
ncbi:lipocalin family protein [Bdellovibrio sp. HCB337]|uniref:lipocalin family protein n=1 Tax=Bdellovibrio sp. HCB337 TaxID=3394358 RepID=UPI0039A5E032